MRKFVLEGNVIPENIIGEKVYISRLSLMFFYQKIYFKFYRRQFFISISHTITQTI